MGFGGNLRQPVGDPETGQQTATENGQRLQVNGGDPLKMPPIGKGLIRALPGNGNTIYIGGPNVDDTTGIPLQAAEDSGRLNVDDFSKYHVYVVSSGDGFAWLAEVE